MTMLNCKKILPAVLMATLASPALAHHSKAMFDDSKCFALSGTVRNFEWQYPHSWLWLIVPVQNAEPQIWGFESMSPAQLEEVDHRWNKHAVNIGDKVTVKFSPLRDGRHGGSMNKVILADGSVLEGAPNSCLGDKAVYGATGLTGNAAPAP
jgi:hypothetical protein